MSHFSSCKLSNDNSISYVTWVFDVKPSDSDAESEPAIVFYELEWEYYLTILQQTAGKFPLETLFSQTLCSHLTVNTEWIFF